MKVNKANFGWIFLCVVLVFGIIISIILGFSGIKSSSSLIPNLKLGDYLQLDVRGNQANALSVNVEGSYLPGEKLKQDLFVKNLEVDNEVYIRGKIYIFSSENNIVDVGVELSPNWKYNLQDGYYYFNEGLSPQNKITFATNIILDESGRLYSGRKYILTFLVETLDSLQLVNSVWKMDFSTFFNEV